MVISDLHYIKPELISKNTTPAVNIFNLSMSDTIMDAMVQHFSILKPDIVLVTGDLTEDGKKQNHHQVAKYLEMLENNGIKIYLTPGNHDINYTLTHFKYSVNTAFEDEIIKKNTFPAIYEKSGYSQPKYKSPLSLRYIAEYSKKLWILSIDGITKNLNRIYQVEGFYNVNESVWLETCLAEAKNNNIDVIAILHHSFLKRIKEHQLFYAQYQLKYHSTLADILMKYGVKIVFQDMAMPRIL